ncbi:MAG TPA: methyltransferase [Saprospiraceae bacterium]|nr:methyltransferase [Saprospiraceae bacterium]
MVVEKIKPAFHFKQFSIVQDRAAMKISTDGVLLGAWTNLKNEKKILDIGTGTGILALMMAQKSSIEVLIDAIEIDYESCLDAEMNFSNSPFKQKINLIHDSIQHFAQISSKKYDLIISNPPYYTDGTSPHDANKANVKHAIKLTHIDLLKSVFQLLKSNGSFQLILPYIEGIRFIKLAESLGLYTAHITYVVSVEGRPIERVLLQFKKQKRKTLIDQIVIKKSCNLEYSYDYINLTKDFYLKFG